MRGSDFLREFAPFLNLGLTSALISVTLVGVFIAWRSSFTFSIAGPDTRACAVLALMAMSVSGESSGPKAR